MDLKDFISSLSDAEPSRILSPELKSLWYEKKGNWQKAHQIIQNESNKTSKIIHAYLHRKEGDLWNANYWYSAAGEKMPKTSLDQEWELLVNSICKST